MSSADKKWPVVAAALPAEHLGGHRIAAGRLRLVQQKGRTFQEAHPDVPVLLDKGRFLVVDLPGAAAELLPSDHHYRVLPMPASGAVFTDLARTQRPADPDVAALLGELEPCVLEGGLHTLTSWRTRLSTSGDFISAATWCRTQLASMGLRARVTSFRMPDGGRSANVVATKAGTAPAMRRRQLVVCAHLDSVNHHGGPTAPAPGADDNASGAAGLLTLADAFAPHRFSHDLVFVLFGGEEQGLFGSRAFVSSLTQNQRRRILGALNMDMIGKVNAEPRAVMLEGAALSRAMIDGLADAAHTYTSLQVQTSLHPYASDHVSFLDAGIPSVLTIEGSDTANATIHSEHDTADAVDLEFARQILTMNAAWLATAAGAAPARTTHQVTDADHQCPGDCGGDCGDRAPDGADGEDCQDCAGCGDEATQAVGLHYGALFALYQRLDAEGLLRPEDHASWNTVCAGYESLPGTGRG